MNHLFKTKKNTNFSYNFDFNTRSKIQVIFKEIIENSHYEP